MVRQVSFSPYGGDTIKALQARQAALQQNAPTLPATQNMRSPWQGASYLANSLVNTLQQNAAVSQERDARQQLAQLVAGHKTGTPWESQEIGNAMALDPELGTHIMDLEAARALASSKQEHWTPVPTPEGENGQWFRNDATGEMKKVGGGTDNSEPKISDTSGLRAQLMGDESYTAMSSTAPIYGSMLKSAAQSDRTSDLDLVSGLAKMIDPTGVVRGEDVNMIVANQPGMETFKSYLGTWTTDPKARLGPEIRKDIMRLAYDRASGAADAYNRRANEFRQIAKAYGIPEEMVVPTFGEITPYAPDEAPADPTATTDPAATTTPAPDATTPEIPYIPVPPGVDADTWPTPEEWKVLTPAQRKQLQSIAPARTP